MSQATNELVRGPVRPVDWQRIGAWAGLGFVAMFGLLAVALVGNAPTLGDGPDAVRGWIAGNATTYMVFMWIGAVAAALFLLPFAAALSQLLEEDEPDNRFLARLVLIGATATAVIGTAGNAFYSALALGSAADLSDAALMAFVRADAFTFWMAVNAFQALVVMAASVAILRSQAFARWLGWLGLAVGLILVAAGLWVVGAELGPLFQGLQAVGLGGFTVWIAATAIAMLRARSNRPPA
jgi:Domain of unknown function (DUF4386)